MKRAKPYLQVGVVVLSGALMAPKCGDPVTVPASDATLPGIGMRIDSNGQTQSTGTASQSISMTTHNPNQIFDTWMTGLDVDGGTRRVTMPEQVLVGCAGPNGSTTLPVPFTLLEESQSGGVGQTVRQGMYIGRRFTPAQLAQGVCPNGTRLQLVQYAFGATAENFHAGVNTFPMIGRVLFVAQ